jgi:hypothetical protein
VWPYACVEFLPSISSCITRSSLGSDGRGMLEGIMESFALLMDSHVDEYGVALRMRLMNVENRHALQFRDLTAFNAGSAIRGTNFESSTASRLRLSDRLC